MTSSAHLLSNYEGCPRSGYYSRQWESHKLLSTAMLYASVRAGLLSEREDFGVCAGEETMLLAADRGLLSDSHDIYDVVVSLAAVADLVTCAIRKPGEAPWSIPEKTKLGPFPWEPSCFQVDDHLRRIALVSHWSDDRHDAELRSWYSVGETAVYGLPMQMVVIIVGQNRNGRRQGPWTKAMRHPNHQKEIRFRKRSGHQMRTATFKDTWKEIMRVDHAEISTHDWLEAMYRDDVLQEVCFNVDIPVPEDAERIKGMALAKLERLYALKTVPEGNLSSCDFPTQCVFKRCCWGREERQPSERLGYDAV